jgi:predicted  nucleic acid-binding Zn-ribbon protein
MCLECGFYNGKMVIDLAAKRKARTERLEAKKAAIAEQEAQFAPETDPVEESAATIEAEVTAETASEEISEADKKDDK